MQKILVFCGSNAGNDPIFAAHAVSLAGALARHNIELVYGGAKVGLMGKMADAVLSAGGRVTGVIPHFLQAKEIAHSGLTTLILVDTLQERKARMSELCDGVIALPGGYGTLDELFEMLTWAQLGLHAKPVALLNTNGYYDPLIAMIDNMVAKAFLKKTHGDLLLVDKEADGLLEKMERYAAPSEAKWIAAS